jgi:hypothetical protein
MCIINEKWPPMTACHAGLLGDNPTPVGSGRLFMHFSRIYRTNVLTLRSFLQKYSLAIEYSHTLFSVARLIYHLLPCPSMLSYVSSVAYRQLMG